MAANQVTLTFAGDATRLTKTFDKVGSDAKGMSSSVGSSSRDLVGSADRAETAFEGVSHGIMGTADVMEGFRTGNVAQMAMGFADIASSMKNLVIPALISMKTFLVAQLAPAMTFVAAHPLLIGAAVVIAGLILLETKFGVVSGAVEWLGEKLSGVFDWMQTHWRGLANIITFPFTAGFNAIAMAWNATVGKLSFTMPDWVPYLGGKGFAMPNLPVLKFHSGGRVPGGAGSESLALLQGGETVIPRGGGMTVIVNVAGSVLTEGNMVDAIHAGLLKKQARSGGLGFA